MEKCWKSLLALPILEAQNAVDIVVHQNNISNNAAFKTIFPPFEQAKGSGPGVFYTLLMERRTDVNDVGQESWTKDDEVLCISSGCFAIYNNERALPHYEACKRRGNEQEVDSILKKCPKEFTKITKTLNAFHVLLVSPKLNFLSMLYSKEFILPIYDFGNERRKMKNIFRQGAKRIRQQTNNVEMERPKELDKRKELERQNESEKQQRESGRQKELEVRNNLGRPQGELDRQKKESERQNELERQKKESERQKELERKEKESERQKELERQMESERQRN